MKKGIKSINKKALILPLFILTILVINLVMVSAAGFTDTFVNSAFFKAIAPYFIPAGMEGVSGLIIGVIALVILFTIFLDIFSLLPMFSKTTNIIIATGLAIIMIVMKWNVTAAGWIFAVGASLFGFAGTFAVFATIIFAIILLIALFIGGSFLDSLTKRFKKIRDNRNAMEAVSEGREAGADAAAIAEAGRTLRKARR